MEDKITVSVQTGNLLIDKTSSSLHLWKVVLRESDLCAFFVIPLDEDTRKDEAQKLRDTEGSLPFSGLFHCSMHEMPARAFAGDRQFKIKLNYVSWSGLDTPNVKTS